MARHPVSRATVETLQILGASIRAARLSRGWSVEQLAQRIGVSHPTVTKVERGDPGVAIGTAFEAATVLGLELYSDAETRSRYGAQKQRELALLPSAARRQRVIDDDF